MLSQCSFVGLPVTMKQHVARWQFQVAQPDRLIVAIEHIVEVSVVLVVHARTRCLRKRVSMDAVEERDYRVLRLCGEGCLT